MPARDVGVKVAAPTRMDALHGIVLNDLQRDDSITVSDLLTMRDADATNANKLGLTKMRRA